MTSQNFCKAVIVFTFADSIIITPDHIGWFATIIFALVILHAFDDKKQ